MSATSLPLPVEDDIIHTRLVNDERVIRRLTRKFHTYAAKYSASTSASLSAPSIEDLRDAFLSELAAYQLFLRKTTLACQSEQRQVLAYQQEKARIANLHQQYREDIASLKRELEEAQAVRRHKMEYDQVAEQINALPSRSELETSIGALQEEIAALQSDKDLQVSLMNARREKFDQLINDINDLRWMGRERGADEVSTPPVEDEPVAMDDREISGDSDAEPLRQSSLNPAAPPFEPTLLPATLPALSRLRTAPSASSPLGAPPMMLDIEMGEVTPTTDVPPVPRAEELEEGEEEGAVDEAKEKVSKVKEELEEGEATDGSSELTELPDDE